MAALAAVDRVVALQPGEVAASVDVQEVGLRGYTNVQRNIEVANRVDIAFERELDGGGGPEWEQEEEETDDRRPHGSHGGGEGRPLVCNMGSHFSAGTLCFFGWCERDSEVFIAAGFGA